MVDIDSNRGWDFNADDLTFNINKVNGSSWVGAVIFWCGSCGLTKPLQLKDRKENVIAEYTDAVGEQPASLKIYQRLDDELFNRFLFWGTLHYLELMRIACRAESVRPIN